MTRLRLIATSRHVAVVDGTDDSYTVVTAFQVPDVPTSPQGRCDLYTNAETQARRWVSLNMPGRAGELDGQVPA